MTRSSTGKSTRNAVYIRTPVYTTGTSTCRRTSCSEAISSWAKHAS